MSTEDKRLAALRRYHELRPQVTRNKLMEAIDRVESGNTVVIKPDAKLTKTNICLEAGVSLHTLLSKDSKNGGRRYAEVIQHIDNLKKPKEGPSAGGDAKDEKIAELRALNQSSADEKVMMAREIDRLGMELLKEKEEVARLSALEEQNMDLREEIRRMLEPATLRLVGGGEGGENGR